jgi:hypothetical protein
VLDKQQNVAVMTTKPEGARYTAFATLVEVMEPNVCCFLATGAPRSKDPAEVTDDKGSVASEHYKDASDAESEPENRPVNFEDHPEAQGVSIERDTPLKSDQDELYRIHVRAGHLSF